MKKPTHKPSHSERVLKQARLCLSRGQFPIPIRPHSKAPVEARWPEQRLSLADLAVAFRADHNLGLLLGEPSGGLVDVDLDCDEAQHIAPSFLPPTDRVHGHKSKPSSHFWYIADPVPAPRKFADLDGSTLVEIRSTGQQTVIPPSVHPSGERLQWEKTGSPARVARDHFFQAVCRVAACALMARHWPAKGTRHDATLALCGFLLRNRWVPEDVETFVSAAAFTSATDEEWAERRLDVRTTVVRLAKEQPATGVPRLSALIGEDVVARLTEWLGISLSSTRIGQFEAAKSFALPWPERPSPTAFHGLLGEIVSAIEPHSEADPVALLAQFVVAFGNAIGRNAYFLVEADRHYPTLFTVLVGATSKARKGSALAHVLRLFREAEPIWTANCVASGLSSGEGLIWAVRDPVFSKGGEEVVDTGVDDKRLLVIESEFAQPLKLMAREGNILSTVIRQAWDSGNLRTLTKHSPAEATGAHISIIGHITQQELLRHLNETELGNGFGNRFLWLCVKRSKLLPEGGQLSDHDVLELAESLKGAIAWARKIKQVKRSTKARDLWKEVYPQLSRGTAGLLGAVTSRAEAQVTRLAMLYGLLDRSRIIQPQHVEAAIGLWSYAEASAQFIFGQSLGDPIADEIFRALLASPAGLTRTEISGLFEGHRKSADITRALVVLAQSGLASCRPEHTGGRPDEKWFLLEYAKNAN